MNNAPAYKPAWREAVFWLVCTTVFEHVYGYFGENIENQRQYCQEDANPLTTEPFLQILGHCAHLMEKRKFHWPIEKHCDLHWLTSRRA